MMENEVNIVQIERSDLGWEFSVDINGQEYRVTVGEDYYFFLTQGKIRPDQLVDRAFDFLMTREPPSSILPEFNLKEINVHYPEFEEVMTQS